MDDSTQDLTSDAYADSAPFSHAAAITRPRARRASSRPAPPSSAAAPVRARDRDRSRRHDRPGRAAATVLVVGLVLLGAAAAEAQTERILVTNAFQTADDSANTSGNDHAQLFHTGGHTDGYILTSVLVNSDDVEDDDFDVEICGADTTANEFPTTDCTALTPPASFVGVGNVPFTHTGLALSANTNYVVVIKQRGSGSVELDSTTSSAEDSQGLSDWSIKNKFYWKSGSTWMIKSGSNEALTIIVYGYEQVAVDTTPPALLSATVAAGGDEIALVFDELMEFNAAVNLPVARFSVTVDGSAATFGQFRTPQGFVDFTQVNLDEFNPDIRGGQTVIVTYTDPAGDDVSPMAFQDLAGNDVASFTTGSSGVPAVINNLPPPPPAVSSVALTSVPFNGFYAIGFRIEATVTFSAAVDITGTPQLELNFDGTPKPATCTAATNTTTMVCAYTVAVNDSAPNGIAIAANKLTLNGGTITATGSTTINADLAHAAVAIDANHKVDGIRPTLVTTGSEAPTTSTDGTQVILTFSENLGSVDRTKITIGIGGGNVAQTSAARVAGTTVELDLSTFIDATVMLTVALDAVAVEDGASNGNLAVPATAVINAIGSTTAPTVTAVALTSAPDDATYGYKIGDEIEATVTFSAAVDITGTPQLELDFAGTPKPAACTADTGTEATLCSYTVVMGDSAPNGIAIAANTLTLNGGTIRATGSTTITADLAHAAVAIDANHKVDGIRPTLVTTGSEAPTTSTDGTKIILFFNEFIGTVDRTKITVKSGTTTQATPLGSVLSGPRLEIALATALTSADTAVTVELGADAVTDGASNGNLAVAATAVTNAVGAPDPPGTLKARRGDGEVHLEWVPVAAVPTDPDRAYQLRYGAAGGESNQWRDIPGSAPGGPHARSYTVTGLENGTRYVFELRVRRGSGFGTAAKIRQTPEAARWSVSTNRRSVHEGEDVTLSIATRNAVGFYSAPEVLTLAVMGQIVLEFATIKGADPEDFEIRVDGTTVQGYTKDITVLNFDKDLDRDPFPAQHFDVEVPVSSTSLDVTVTVLADEEEDGQEHMTFMVFRGEELVNEDTWDETGVNIESRDAGVVKQLAVADAEATEGEDPSLDFVVTLAPAAAWTVTVDYATADGTARAGSDYTDTSGALTFAPGETAKTVSVPVIDDTVEDTPETLTVRLSNANPPYNEEEGAWEWGSQEAGVLIADAVATGTIRNTEDQTAVDLSADFPEGAFTSTRHTGSDDRPQVVVAFSEAVAEFAANTPSVSVTGASGVSVQTHTEDGLENAYVFFMTPDGDGDVTFALTTNAACAAGGICTADGTVLTQVPAAWTIPGPSGDSSSLSVADAEATEEEDSTMAFVVTLDPAASDTVTVDYATSDGSAEAGNDYTATSGTLSFSAGETRKTISVAISDDTDNEGDETFTVTLSNAAGADLGTQAATGTIRNRPVAPLTASFSGVPAEHDGSEFTVDLTFSENVAAGYARIRDHAFSVNGATIKKAQRKTQGSNQHWTVTVDPTDNGGVSITLPATTNCSAQGAICTADGRRLSNSSSATVAGPAAVVETTPTVSIAGGSGTEGDDGAIAFTVTLDEAASGTVTVDYATADGSAEAGDDYTAASGTLRFAAGETSKTISVAIDDDIDNESDETFTVTLSNASGADLGTQAATGTIRNRPVAPLTASFSNMPAEHNGSTFTFDLSFSENVAAGYARIRDHAFSVNGANIKKAQRKTQGSNQNWTVTVDPTGNGGVSITLPETTTCHNAGGICTDDGRKLNHSTSDSVQGPVGIAVSDARVEEAAGAVLAFAVTLSRSASSPITIHYATADGSATAGADYTAASGILTIESGSSSGRIEVTVLDDSHNDGDETLTLTLSNASSGVLTDATATGTIENHDAMPRALVARFGRTAAVHIVEQVEARVNAPRRPGFDGRVAGREINRTMGREFALDFLRQLGGQAGYSTPVPGTAGQQTRHPGAGGSGLGGTPLNTPGGGMNPAMGGLHSGGMEQMHGDQAGPYGMGIGFQRDRVLSGSEFALNRATSSGGILSFWSRSAQSQFHGRDGVMALNGDVRTTMFGADYSKGRMVTGVSLSHSRGLGNYASVDTGRMTSAVTGLYPWIGYKASDRVTVWTVAGYGAGGLLLNPGAGPAIETGLSMAMVAGGGRGQILGDGNGFGLAVKADALWVGTHTKAVDGPGGRLAATDAAVNRLRTALEGSHTLTIGTRMALTPSVEVGIRQDGGDAETGTGMDVGAGLVFADAVYRPLGRRPSPTARRTPSRRVRRARPVDLGQLQPDADDATRLHRTRLPRLGRRRHERRRGAVGPREHGGHEPRVGEGQRGPPPRHRSRLRAADRQSFRRHTAGGRAHIGVRPRLPHRLRRRRPRAGTTDPADRRGRRTTGERAGPDAGAGGRHRPARARARDRAVVAGSGNGPPPTTDPSRTGRRQAEKRGRSPVQRSSAQRVAGEGVTSNAEHTAARKLPSRAQPLQRKVAESPTGCRATTSTNQGRGSRGSPCGTERGTARTMGSSVGPRWAGSGAIARPGPVDREGTRRAPATQTAPDHGVLRRTRREARVGRAEIRWRATTPPATFSGRCRTRCWPAISTPAASSPISTLPRCRSPSPKSCGRPG